MPPDLVGHLAGRTCLVTGAGNGLGRAIARQLGHGGARVILVGRDDRKLEDVAGGIPGSTRVEVCDVTSEEATSQLAAVLGDETIDVLVNNAGIPGPVAPLTAIGAAEWDAVFAVNVRGVFLMCRAFLPPMVARGRGHVINIASVSGKRPLTFRTPYASSKMAVLGLTATLAHEVGAQGVLVNSLSPGPVSGPRMTRNFALEAARTGSTVDAAEQAFVGRAALGRMVTEEEVAEAVSAMLTMTGLSGADIDLSGGMIAR